MQREMTARILHQSLSFGGQNGVAAQAKDEIGIANFTDLLHQLRIGEMPVAAQQDMGMRPVLAQNMQHSLHDHGILDTRRALDLGAAHGSHQGS